MRVFGAEEFEIVRREIDDQHFAARFQRASSLRDGAAGIVEIVQHLVDDDEVGAAGGPVEIGDIAEADLRMRNVGGGFCARWGDGCSETAALSARPACDAQNS